ncbi:Lysine-specific demethylase 3A [Podila verticillata]|nr:Lysine-specific demethylase 3A [Podila verticillata]
MATTPEAIVAETADAEFTSTPVLPCTCEGKDHLTSHDTSSSVHSGTAPRTEPLSKEKLQADEQRVAQVDAVEDKQSKEDTELEHQEELELEPTSKPVQQRLARTERPKRAAAKIASTALLKVARVLSSVDTSGDSSSSPDIVQTTERHTKRKALEIVKKGRPAKRAPQEPVSQRSVSSLRESTTPPPDSNTQEADLGFEWPPRKIVLGPSPPKPFREPISFLQDRIQPYGSFDQAPHQEQITSDQRQAVDHQLTKIVRTDRKTGEIRYICQHPTHCTKKQKLVLETAFLAKQTRLLDYRRTKDPEQALKEDECGFVSALADCTAEVVKSYFSLRVDIEMGLLMYDKKGTLVEVKTSTSGPEGNRIEASPFLTSTSADPSLADNHKSASMTHSREVSAPWRTKGAATSRNPTIQSTEKPDPASRSVTKSNHRITSARHNKLLLRSYAPLPIDTIPLPNIQAFAGTNVEGDSPSDDAWSPVTPKDTELYNKPEQVEPKSSMSLDDSFGGNSVVNDGAIADADSTYILTHIGGLAKPLLESELIHLGSHGDENSQQGRGASLRLKDYISNSALIKPEFCCYCRACIFSAMFVCRHCAKTFCADCHASPKVLENSLCLKDVSHQREMLSVCGRYPVSILKPLAERLHRAHKTLPNRVTAPIAPHQHEFKASRRERATPRKNVTNNMILEYREPCRYHHADLYTLVFQEHWKQGDVLLLHYGSEDRFQSLNWDLYELVEQSGESTVHAIQCSPSQKMVQMNLDEYRKQGKVRSTSEKVVWKMEGWPSQDLDRVLPFHCLRLFEDLPLKEYTHPYGKYNLAKYMPADQGLTLGPKIYHGHGWGDQHVQKSGYGSMQLSCEPSDSLYVCVATSAPYRHMRSERDTVVVWDIFRAEDRPRVEAFLRRTTGDNNNSRHRNRNKGNKIELMEPTDPFTNGNTYLDDEQLQQLYEETCGTGLGRCDRDIKNPGKREGVRPYRVEQVYSEVLMIPAGCLRQARYVYDATLVRMHFMSPERMNSTIDWMEDVTRRYNPARQAQAAGQKLTRHNSKYCESVPDTLQAKSVLLHSALAMLP